MTLKTTAITLMVASVWVLTTGGALAQGMHGAFEVDPLAAERAMERALTQNGALLLPKGSAEVQWDAGFAYSEKQTSTLLAVSGQTVMGQVQWQRTEFNSALSARLGLTQSGQIELSMPHQRAQESQTSQAPGAISASINQHHTTRGDLTLGWAQTLWNGANATPAVIGRLSWQPGIGSADSTESYRKIRLSLSAVKRQDPLVFTSQLQLQWSAEKQGLQPGRQLGLSVNALLAASPDTSLSAGLEQTFAKPWRTNGIDQPGPTQIASMLVLGCAHVWHKQALVSITAGVGLSKAAPNYSLAVSVPVRFELFK
jgi:hypothetical protein